MMIRNAIISLTAVLCSDVAMAQDQGGVVSASALAEKHWAFVVERCPVQAQAHANATSDSLSRIFESAFTDEVTGSPLSQNGLPDFTDLDVYFGTFAVVNSATVSEALKFMAQYTAASDVTQDADLRIRTQASIALSECIWPSRTEQQTLSGSRWAAGFADTVTGVCDIHFFTMVQRYLDTPITHLTADERQLAGETIIAEHEQYLEASKDPSQCGEFL